MLPKLSEKFTLEKTLIYVVIAAVVVTFVFIFYLLVLNFSKNIEIQSPVGGENWEIGKTYEVRWKARGGIDKVGIVLFKGEEPKWIAKDVLASLGRYEWTIYPGQDYGDDYWMAVFQYPWKPGNKIAYSSGAFAIVFSELGSCEGASLQNEWPLIPSDYPNARRVFITSQAYNGNLDGLAGADQKCQQEAEQMNLEGTWKAFLGGDDENEIATKRLARGPRKTDGVFVEATVSSTLTRGATCHRLLGKDISEFIAKLSDPIVINEEKISSDFLSNLKNVWLGRLDERSAENCTTIASNINQLSLPLAQKYSFTTTCQNWTKGTGLADGYPVPFGSPKPAFPRCYTKEGKATDAVGIAALAMGTTGGAKNADALTPFQGKLCNVPQKLICIEE